jgi:hypothetical protein
LAAGFAKTAGIAVNQKRVIIVVSIVVIAIGVLEAWNNRGRSKMPPSNDLSAEVLASSEHESTVRQLVSSEELLLELTPRLRALSRSVRNLQLPDTSARKLFLEEVAVSGRLARSTETSDSVTGPVSYGWLVETDNKVAPSADLALWNELFNETEYFETASFYFVRGNFEEGTFDEFQSRIGFDGLTKYQNGRQAALHAELDVSWSRQNQEHESVWRISSWNLNKFRTLEAAKPLFRDVLTSAITDPAVLARARISRHEQITSALLKGEDIDRPTDDDYPFFFPDVTLEHPGIAIVDIDADGFDDLFVAMQHGANLLFRNLGNGTFTEVAAEYGLETSGDSTSAMFADFDNDGDPDLFLGRARHRSLYFVNEDGRFVERSDELVAVPLPYMVSSISAADYNGDGLLDVYLSTYSPIEEIHRLAKQGVVWTQYFLTFQEQERLRRELAGAHSFLRRPGPPNVLLVNMGDGKFEQAKEGAPLELWRKSFQASWSDFDADGDPDLYVANDYAPDNLFRNDLPHGFTDITNDAGLNGMGFGMGVAWGDYDNDGYRDLYISNMYSKAGQRITSRISGIDPRFREMAEGNFLYRHLGDQFSLVSGLTKPALTVAKAGWSWGGQFLDFNNDGFRDVYVASGFYTAPADIAVDIDL